MIPGYDMAIIRITGMTPTIQHNGRLANPLDVYSKKLKEITSKRKKTDKDHEDMARIEHEGSLYLNEKSQVIWPDDNIQAMIVAGAKRNRLGVQATTGILCEDTLLEYEGPKNSKQLFENLNFRLTTGVVINRSRIMRTRPIFHSWSATLTINFLPDVIEFNQILEAAKNAGRFIGLSDWRPRYGLFKIEKAEHVRYKEGAGVISETESLSLQNK
jgi:hypothetical protein